MSSRVKDGMTVGINEIPHQARNDYECRIIAHIIYNNTQKHPLK